MPNKYDWVVVFPGTYLAEFVYPNYQEALAALRKAVNDTNSGGSVVFFGPLDSWRREKDRIKRFF